MCSQTEDREDAQIVPKLQALTFVTAQSWKEVVQSLKSSFPSLISQFCVHSKQGTPSDHHEAGVRMTCFNVRH